MAEFADPRSEAMATQLEVSSTGQEQEIATISYFHLSPSSLPQRVRDKAVEMLQ